jgi:hypothetical protein
MAVEVEFREESFEGPECFGVGLDEGLCINYHPGKLAEIEDALNEERERIFAQEFLFGCGS